MKSLALIVSLAAAATAQDSVSYHKQIRPILMRQCQGCHQPASRQSDLLLTSYAGFAKGGRKGPSFIAGDPGKSVVVQYLTGEVKPVMPFGGKPLPPEQIELFRQWIQQGAKDDTPAGAGDSAVSASPVKYVRPPVIMALAIAPDGKSMAVSGYREILLLDEAGKLMARMPGLAERLHSLSYTPDGARLVAVGGSPARFGEVQIWDVASRKELQSTVVSNDTLFGGSLSPDGTRLAAASPDKSVRIFDVSTGKELKKLDHHEDWSFATAFGRDGKRLVSVGRDRAAKLSDAATGRFIENVNLLKEPLISVARHPQRDWIAVGGDERVPYLYMMDRPRAMRIADDSTLIRKFEPQDGAVLSLAFSPDGQLLAVGSTQGAVRVYDIETGEAKAKCQGHSGGIYTLQFFPDGKRLATAGFDGTVRVYDLEGKLTASFVPAPVDAVVISQK